MDVIFKIIIFVGLSIPVDSKEIEILGSGLERICRNDLLMRFYVTLQNRGRKPRNVFAHMVECCESLSEDEVDCESFRLYEDYMKILPGMTKNVTLVYPNVYVYNRKGTCMLSILHRLPRDESDSDKPTELQHHISFDTTVKNALQEVPYPLVGYYDPASVLKCESKDLDPFDGCAPVNCIIKYSGYRNFYNPTRKTCQKVPLCLGDPRKELADVVYVPNINTCRDLENFVKEKDIFDIINGKVKEPDLNLLGSRVNIQCHHGQIDVKTGLCICDYGWKSEPFDPDVSSAVYHMCSVQCRKPPNYPLVPFTIGLLLALWAFLCICFCEKYQFACQFMDRVTQAPQDDCTCVQYVANGESYAQIAQ